MKLYYLKYLVGLIDEEAKEAVFYIHFGYWNYIIYISKAQI